MPNDLTTAAPAGPPAQLTTEQPAENLSAFASLQQELLQEYTKARSHLERIVKDWDSVAEKTNERRKTRDIDVNVKELRDSGDLDEDETLIPCRVIDENITRELPPYVNYLKNSRRIAIFNCISDPTTNSQEIELEFTRGMTYTGWETPHYKCLDGSATHGWDAVEVVYDPSKPLNVGIEHIGHDKLFFPQTAVDLQASSDVIRAYDVTTLQLKSFVEKYGFDAPQVNKILDSVKNTQKSSETIRIHKRLMKFEGCVYVSWFSLANGVNDWLKKPDKMFVGIKKQDPTTGEWVKEELDMYPIFILPYRETEKPKLIDKKGRVYMDESKQEAKTAVTSGFVNGITRASNIYASPSQEDGTGSSLKELENIRLSGGRILSRPMNFWHTDYPDPMVIRSLDYMDRSNAQETSQVNFAAMNREDSRKTAKEIGAAQEQQQLLNSVQLTLFSTHIRSVYSFAWLIVQSQASQGAIIFLRVKKQKPVISQVDNQPVVDPTTGQPMMQDYWENNLQIIMQTYDVRAAGDVDVIQKEETVMKMKQDWPVISTTVLRDVFLADMIRLEYPDLGEKYAKILETQGNIFNNCVKMLSSMGDMLTGVLKDNPAIMPSLAPEEQQGLQQVLQQAAQMVQQASAIQQPQQAQQ